MCESPILFTFLAELICQLHSYNILTESSSYEQFTNIVIDEIESHIYDKTEKIITLNATNSKPKQQTQLQVSPSQPLAARPICTLASTCLFIQLMAHPQHHWTLTAGRLAADGMSWGLLQI